MYSIIHYIEEPMYLIVLGAITSAIPAICMKQYAHSHEIHWLLISLISYIILLYVYYTLFEFSGVYNSSSSLTICVVVVTPVCIIGAIAEP